MYGVNAGDSQNAGAPSSSATRRKARASRGTARASCCDILATPVSPELLPPDEDGEIAQQTEDRSSDRMSCTISILYYVLRFGFAPAKIYRLAQLCAV